GSPIRITAGRSSLGLAMQTSALRLLEEGEQIPGFVENVIGLHCLKRTTAVVTPRDGGDENAGFLRSFDITGLVPDEKNIGGLDLAGFHDLAEFARFAQKLGRT